MKKHMQKSFLMIAVTVLFTLTLCGAVAAVDTSNSPITDNQTVLYTDNQINANYDNSELNLLVVNSQVNNYQDLVSAAGSDVVVVVYNGSQDTKTDLMAKMQDALAGQKADSIAFATHNKGPYGNMQLSADGVVDLNSVSTDQSMRNYWQNVGGLLKPDGRIDILTCKLASTPDGLKMVEELEKLTEHKVAASTNLTGNPNKGGDWILETEKINIAPVYFNQEKVANFNSLMAGPYAYITNASSNNVSVIDTSTNTVIATIPVGTLPYGVAVSPDGTRVYITNEIGNSVSVINTSTNTVIATIPVGIAPVGVAVSPDGSRAYVTNLASGTVSVINTTTNAVINIIPVGVTPFGIAVSPDGSRAYVTNLVSSSVSVIDTNFEVVLANIGVGINPYGIAVSPNGTRVYTANASSNNVSVIDATTNLVITTITVGISPIGVAVSPSGIFVYVTNQLSNNVSVINAITNLEIGTIPVGSVPNGVAVSPDGSRLYVVNDAVNNVSVINTLTYTVIATIHVGSAPIAFGDFIGPASSVGGLANYTSSVEYYKASDIPNNDAAQQSFMNNPTSFTPISSADAGQQIVKVIRLQNSGAASHSVQITDIIDETYQNYNDYDSWTNNPAPNTWQHSGTYNMGTGKWDIGNVGSPNDPANLNQYNNFLFIYTTIKLIHTDQTITNTMDVTRSLDSLNTPNAAPPSALHISKTLTVQPVSDVSVVKSFMTRDAAKTDITNGTIKYGGVIWMKLHVQNDGPSAASSVSVTDAILNGLTLDTSVNKMLQYSSATDTNTESPANVSIAAGTMTWTIGTIYQSQFLDLWVPLKVTISGTKFTNTATETQTTKNTHPGATLTSGKWTINSNTATLTVPKASNLTITKVFVNGSGVPQTSTYYGDNDLYALITVTNSGPDAANWVVAEDLLNPLLWTIDYSRIATSYDGGITWATNDTNVYMLGNYLAWVVSPRKVTQTELAVLMLGIPLPNMPAPALLASGATAMIKIPITAAVTGTPAILGTNAAAIVYSDPVYSQDVGLPAQRLTLAEIAIQRSADLGIVKTVSDNTPDSGDVITFTLTATSNTGVNGVGNLVKARVTDFIDPQYFKFVNISFKNVTNLTKPYQSNYTYDAATGKLDWTIGNLDDGAYTQAVITVQVLKNAATAAVDNTATIEGWWQSTLPVNNYPIHDLDPSNNSSTVTVNVNGTTIPPLTVVSTTPSNNSDYYGLTKPVYITFSNAVSLTGAGSVLIKNLTSGANISAPIVTVSGSQLKIQLAKSRLKNNVYQITMPAGLVVDQYGQKNAAFTLSFTAKE